MCLQRSAGARAWANEQERRSETQPGIEEEEEEEEKKAELMHEP